MSIGILLGNLGTPQSPAVKHVKSYLREFLMDPYVIDRPFWQRWFLVNILIVPLRAPKSAKAYEKVWMKQGSPLMVFSERLRDRLREKFTNDFKISLGMRYGEPSIRRALEELKDCESIWLAHQYPQFAWSSYQTWVDKAMEEASRLGLQEKVKVLKPFFAEPEYLTAQFKVIEQTWKAKPCEHLLFSFHGLPESHVARLPNGKIHSCLKERCVEKITADNEGCYRSQCYFVAREMAARLGLKDKQWSVSFQSRLGREPWIGPYTDHVIPKIAENNASLAVTMPAFTTDCLETLEEIGMVGKAQFLQSGGREFVTVPCMNDQSPWVEGFSQLLKKHFNSQL